MIVFAHLLNDLSGSPRVLCSAIAALNQSRDESRLFVGSDGSGCLNQLDISTTRYWYKYTPFRWLTLLTYFFSQLSLFVRLLTARGVDRNALIYVNTLLPFGAALYGWVTRRRVVYHLHEISISPAPLRLFLIAIARLTASDLIYVSDFHRRSLPVCNVATHTIHNSLDTALIARANTHHYTHRNGGMFKVLMLASLRDYKGIPEFLALAARIISRTDVHFDLVCNDGESSMQRYFSSREIPGNVTVHPRSSDPAEYYSRASLVLNLSRPDKWVETFGLTLLEAMAFGVPVIAPPVGGPTEIVSDGVEGYLVSSYEVERIANLIVELADDEEKTLQLSQNAKKRAGDFTPQQFESQLREVIGD